MSDRRSEKSRAALLASARRLLPRQPDVSLVEVAEQAGVGRATLYRHFRDKRELVDALCLITLAELDEAGAQIDRQARSARQAFELLFRALGPLADRLPIVELAEQSRNEAVQRAVARQNREICDLVEWARQEGVMRSDLPTDWIVRLVNYLVGLCWESQQAGECSPEEASALALSTLFDGAGTGD